MPELPEVETIVRTLRPRLVGQILRRIHLARTDILTPSNCDLPKLLANQRVTAIDRRGKKILIRLQSGQALGIHLGMTGRLTIEPAATPIAPHTHLRIDLASPNSAKPSPHQLRFRDPRRFGGLWFLSDHAWAEHNMGPEPLGLRAATLAKALARTRRAIKTTLLDQTILAGLGNIYADEALFRARIHPQTPANTLSLPQVALLNRAIKHVLQRAINHRGSTLRDYVDADGAAGRFQKLHQVYARASHPCPHCQTPILRIILTGRSTHFCPTCQPAPTPPR